ncbi:MAG: hypothetical protein IPM27_01890 [Nitrosomonadales bacterium]|nr:hypothetical protein [Nitrosomonadales bacterium]
MTQQLFSNNEIPAESTSLLGVLKKHHWLMLPIVMAVGISLGLATNTLKYGAPSGGYLEVLTDGVLPNLEIALFPSFAIGMVLALILWGILKTRKPEAWKWHNWLNMGLYISLAIMMIRPVFFS